MEIPKLKWDSEEALACIAAAKPVVLLECPICYPAMSSWTYERVSQIIKPDFQCDVYSSYTHRFQYSDEKKNNGRYDDPPPTGKKTMTFNEFHKYIKSHRTTSSSKSFPNLYLQQALVAEMGPLILGEYTKFSLATALQLKQIGGWDALTNNLLLCGKEGFITPVHFDEQENLFAQLNGRKRIRLFHPHNWFALYPYPIGHPCDRQSQVVLPTIPGSTVLESERDRERFPSFSTIGTTLEGTQEMFVDLEPGQVVYIPQYWFHQMEALSDNISLSWWFTHSTKKGIDVANIKLKDISLVAVRRNLEKLISEMAGSGQKAHNFFLAVASGLTKIPPWPQINSALSGAAAVKDGVDLVPKHPMAIESKPTLPPPPPPPPPPTTTNNTEVVTKAAASDLANPKRAAKKNNELKEPISSQAAAVMLQQDSSKNEVEQNTKKESSSGKKADSSTTAVNSVSLLIEANYSKQFHFPPMDPLVVDVMEGQNMLYQMRLNQNAITKQEDVPSFGQLSIDDKPSDCDGVGPSSSNHSQSSTLSSSGSSGGDGSPSANVTTVVAGRPDPPPKFGPVPMTPEDVQLWDSIVHQSLTFISLILKPEDARGFLMQLVAGRFNAF